MSEVWFDTREGSLLIGEAAIEQGMQESMPGDLLPLHCLLTGEIPFDEYEYRRQRARQWDLDDFIALGQSTLALLRAHEKHATVTQTMLWRQYKLGLAPMPRKFIGSGKTFSNIADYRYEIGAPDGRKRPGLFDGWTKSDLIDYARCVEAHVGGKPTKNDYVQFARDNPDAPGIHIIAGRFRGEVSELNEHLGYVNTRTWSQDDYLDFGVKVIEANDPARFNMTTFTVLARAKYGPSLGAIRRNYGLWQKYRQDVFQAYNEKCTTESEERLRKLKRYHGLVDDGHLPGTYTDLPEDQLLTYGARYELICSLAKRMDTPKQTAAIQAKSNRRFISYILNSQPDSGLTVADIEVEAATLGVYDDLWPMDAYKEWLKVTDEDLGAVRVERNATRNDERQRRRQQTT